MSEKISLGVYLKETRQSKGLSLDEISRETNITKSYLELLEQDEFDSFPAETYVHGFLMTYAEALEINKEEVLSLYHRQMRIEQDAPLEELVGKKKTPVVSVNPATLGGIAGAIIGFILLLVLIANISKNRREMNKPPRKAMNITIEAKNIQSLSESNFVVGDIITITNGKRSIQIGLNHRDGLRNLEILVNKKRYQLKTGAVLSVDSDENNINDLSLELFAMKKGVIKLSVAILDESKSVETNVVSDVFEKYRDVILSESVIIPEGVKKKVSMSVNVKGHLWMEYQADNNEPKQNAYRQGDHVNIEFQDALILSLANAGAAELQIGDKIEKGGSWGEASKSLFYWKNNNGKFSLMRAILR